jgi:dTDP-4-amino-4,6-dideoxygalactose transaminase
VIPFNKPFLTGKELEFISDAHKSGHLSGDGKYTGLSSEMLSATLDGSPVLLTQSCTAALEMAAILADIQPGDEVIMPSFTFVSTANAFVLRGGVPVFVDIRSDTKNIDERIIEAAITSRTKAICVVHYAGVACEMDTIMAVARRHNLLVIEDAAQAIYSTYTDRPLGSIGDLGCFSFHETKNVISGEGGALVINNPALLERAEIIREKGTNRSRFLRGQTDKYTWQDVGSSFLPSEVTAAFLYAQLLNGHEITATRLSIFDTYLNALGNTRVGVPFVPENTSANGHMFYLEFSELDERTRFIDHMNAQGVMPVFHYVPLHSSPAGQRFGRVHGELPVTDSTSDGLVRLPLFPDLGNDVHRVIAATAEFLDA